MSDAMFDGVRGSGYHDPGRGLLFGWPRGPYYVEPWLWAMWRRTIADREIGGTMKLARFRVNEWESYGLVEGAEVRAIQGSIFGNIRFHRQLTHWSG